MALRMTVGARFALSVGASVSIAIVVTIATNMWLTSRMAMDAVQHELNVVDGFFRTRLEDTAQRALSMADEMALNTAVQDAFAARAFGG